MGPAQRDSRQTWMLWSKEACGRGLSMVQRCDRDLHPTGGFVEGPFPLRSSDGAECTLHGHIRLRRLEALSGHAWVRVSEKPRTSGVLSKRFFEASEACLAEGGRACLEPPSCIKA